MRTERDPFDWHVMRHLNAAYNLARWYVRGSQDAEDIVQDSVVKAYQAFPTFRGADGKPWLLQIVRNSCMRHVEKQRRAPTSAFEEEMNAIPAPDDPLAAAIDRVDVDGIRAAIASLPDPFREVLILREFEDMSYAEIAKVVDVPVGTVMSRLSRARALLGQAIVHGREECE